LSMVTMAPVEMVMVLCGWLRSTLGWPFLKESPAQKSGVPPPSYLEVRGEIRHATKSKPPKIFRKFCTWHLGQRRKRTECQQESLLPPFIPARNSTT
jgi:hypothetical protein